MVRARISNLLGKITILVMVGLCVNTAAALDGSGTEEDPWRIKSLEDFNDFAADANYWDDYTRLETDVNLAGMVYDRAVIAPDEDDFYDGFLRTAFTGVFDGNDHKIMNVTIDDGGTGNDYLGLFGRLNGGKVGKLSLEGGSVSGDWYVGGLVGKNDGNISDCYSIGSVSGYNGVGGLVGWNDYGSVSDCYSIGDVSGRDGNVGGLVGENIEGSISNFFWDTDTQTHGVTDSIGYIVGTAKNVFGLPTAQMQTISTFTDADWDFINVWNIGENQTYPYLRVYLTGDINKDRIVNFFDFAIEVDKWMEGD